MAKWLLCSFRNLQGGQQIDWALVDRSYRRKITLIFGYMPPMTKTTLGRVRCKNCQRRFAIATSFSGPLLRCPKMDGWGAESTKTSRNQAPNAVRGSGLYFEQPERKRRVTRSPLMMKKEEEEKEKGARISLRP